MELKKIAARLIELCEKGDWDGAHQELYAEDAVSIEPRSVPGFEKETKGLAAMNAKGRLFDSMVEIMHTRSFGKPVFADNVFAMTMFMDATYIGQGRGDMTELCVYTVRDGKIISEQFFY